MAYEFTKEIAEAGIMSVVPSYAPYQDSFFYVQEATENDWNNLMQDIGILELGLYESTGVEVVYEEGNEENTEVAEKKSNALIEFVKNAWARIKSLFEDLLNWATGSMKHAADKLKEKFGNDLFNKLSKGRLADTIDGSTQSYGTFYTYDGLEKQMNASNYKAGEGSNVSERKKSLMSDMRGTKQDVTVQWLMDNIDNLIKLATDFKFTKGSIVKHYNDIKKGYDQQIKEAKAAKDKSSVDFIKTRVTNLNIWASAVVASFHERQAKALGIVTRVAVKTLSKSHMEKEEDKNKKEAKKKEKELLKQTADKTKADKKAAKEAEKAAKQEPVAASYTDPNGTPVLESYSTEVEKLFDWNF